MILYAPIVKAKSGEMSGVNDVDPVKKDYILPLIEHPIDADESATFDQIMKLNGFKTIGLDLTETLLNDCLKSPFLTKQIIPIARHGSPMSESIKSTLETYDLGLIYRVPSIDFLSRWQSGFDIPYSVTPSNVDILVELPSLAVDPSVMSLIFSHIDQVYRVRGHGYRSIIIAGSSLPGDNSAFNNDTVTERQRIEWNSYSETGSLELRSSRFCFSDYLINDNKNVPSASHAPSICTLRYSGPSTWLVSRGSSQKATTSQDACRQLVNHHDYSGRNFSAGDDWIGGRAENEEFHTKQNASGWRRNCISHHVTNVLHQVANLHGIEL